MKRDLETVRVSERDRLLGAITLSLSENAGVLAVWLEGSLGRGDGDSWSDIDIWVVVRDEEFSGFISKRSELIASVGDPVLVQEAPQNGPASGINFMSGFDCPGGLQLVDWYVQPAKSAKKPSSKIVTFVREELSRSVSWSSSEPQSGIDAIFERSRMGDLSKDEDRPHVDWNPHPDDERSNSAALAWAMIAIQAKQIVREPNAVGLPFMEFISSLVASVGVPDISGSLEVFGGPHRDADLGSGDRADVFRTAVEKLEFLAKFSEAFARAAPEFSTPVDSVIRLLGSFREWLSGRGPEPTRAAPPLEMPTLLRNWARNYFYGAARVRQPASIEEIQAVVRGSGRVKALGTRHSFSSIADTTGDLISLEKLCSIRSVNTARLEVTIDGGVTYGALASQLAREGYAVHNLASLPHISAAGACATATHGSGDRNGNLATAVTQIELVTADGTLTQLSLEQDWEPFLGAVVSLGALGIVTKLTLRVEPAFLVAQRVYEKLPFESVFSHFDEITSSAYSVSLFTDWQGDSINQVWTKGKSGLDHAPAGDLFGASPAPGPRHPLPSGVVANCTEQMGIAGSWHERLAHFRMDHTPSSGEELQSEYLVPREHAVAALRAIRELRNTITPLLHISEIRTIASDELWMSPCYLQPCVGIHFTWQKKWPEVRRLLPAIESALEPFHARPHWGKLFAMPGDRVRSLYPRLADFQRLVESFDPGGKFRNSFLDSYVL